MDGDEYFITRYGVILKTVLGSGSQSVTHILNNLDKVKRKPKLSDDEKHFCKSLIKCFPNAKYLCRDATFCDAFWLYTKLPSWSNMGYYTTESDDVIASFSTEALPSIVCGECYHIWMENDELKIEIVERHRNDE